MNIYDNDIKRKLKRHNTTTFLNIDKKIKLNQNSDKKNTEKMKINKNSEPPMLSLRVESVSIIFIYIFALVKYFIYHTLSGFICISVSQMRDSYAFFVGRSQFQ